MNHPARVGKLFGFPKRPWFSMVDWRYEKFPYTLLAALERLTRWRVFLMQKEYTFDADWRLSGYSWRFLWVFRPLEKWRMRKQLAAARQKRGKLYGQNSTRIKSPSGDWVVFP